MNYSTTQEKLICIWNHSIMLIEREQIKNMLNYIERTGNFRGVIRFNDVKHDVMRRIGIKFVRNVMILQLLMNHYFTCVYCYTINKYWHYCSPQVKTFALQLNSVKVCPPVLLWTCNPGVAGSILGRGVISP